ncbi:ribbon-helix-helix domain-containing protein [Roseateles sp. BYS180W]|uniref:Ribbon-helix-helix domain-containing protein n=1 Tax=Roseateles rivi TaxID=3299028 RepID=A0ABW7FWM3_9BURK
MCEFYVKADPILYEQRTRSLRIHGVLTSLRLENLVWDVLAEMAQHEGCTTNALICTFHDEILLHRGEVPNFASFLRVTCMRYLQRELLRSRAQSLGTLPPSSPELALGAAAPATPQALRLLQRAATR